MIPDKYILPEMVSKETADNFPVTFPYYFNHFFNCRLKYYKSIGDFESVALIYQRIIGTINEEAEQYLGIYAQRLHSQGMISNATEILKSCPIISESIHEAKVDFVAVCQTCRHNIDPAPRTFCRQCERKSKIECSLCLKSCSGNIVVCHKYYDFLFGVILGAIMEVI